MSDLKHAGFFLWNSASFRIFILAVSVLLGLTTATFFAFRLRWIWHARVATLLTTVAAGVVCVHAFVWPQLAPHDRWWELARHGSAAVKFGTSGLVVLETNQTTCSGSFELRADTLEISVPCSGWATSHARLTDVCIVTAAHDQAHVLHIHACDTEHNRRLVPGGWRGEVPKGRNINPIQLVPCNSAPSWTQNCSIVLADASFIGSHHGVCS